MRLVRQYYRRAGYFRYVAGLRHIYQRYAFLCRLHVFLLLSKLRLRGSVGAGHLYIFPYWFRCGLRCLLRYLGLLKIVACSFFNYLLKLFAGVYHGVAHLYLGYALVHLIAYGGVGTHLHETYSYEYRKHRNGNYGYPRALFHFSAPSVPSLSYTVAQPSFMLLRSI